jgi:hypothetical protein
VCVECLLKHWQILRVFIFPGNTESSHRPLNYWELSLSLKKLSVLSDYWSTKNIPKESCFYWKIEKVERPSRGPTATKRGETASYCNLRGLTATKPSQTVSSSNDQKFELKVVFTFLAVWPRVALWSESKMCRILPTTSFWSVRYKYSSISCKRWLLAISTTYLTLESPLHPHTSIPWAIVDVWDSSAWFEYSLALRH